MKFYALLAVLLLGGTSFKTQAESFGIGVAVKSGDTTLLVPYKLGQNYFLEPYFRYQKHSDDDEFGERENEFFSVGVGFFQYKITGEAVNLYYGLKAGYSERNYTYYYPPDPAIPVSAYINEEKLNGYELSPTFGISYVITPKFSIDGELEWYYQNLDGKINDNGEISNSKYETQGTNTRIFLRYFF